jgi:predicted kinase
LSRPLPLVVVVSGAPATGKSTLALKLGAELDLPVLGKDRFKEVLFETLGTPELERSDDFGRASFYLMDAALRWLLDAGVGAVYESNFIRGLSEVELRAHLPRCRAVQLHCAVPHELIFERYEQRHLRGDRHPGHRDGERIERVRSGRRQVRWEHYDEPLDLDVPTLRIDTSDGYRPGLEEIVAFARERVQAK